MEPASDINVGTLERRLFSYKKRSYGSLLLTSLATAIAVFLGFYVSLIETSAPVALDDQMAIERAIDILDEKGFDDEVFLLRKTASYRSTDHWFNGIILKENAYAATNFPFQIITIYPDFYDKAVDDIERAMILLHEARHLQAKDEADAYAYVWRNRDRLGWTQLSHGTTPTYITIEEETRSVAPDLFACPQNLWNDCTEDKLGSYRVAE